MRWIFLDENNATETENKQRTIERIDNFWKWYSQFVAETKPSIEREDLSRFMSDFASELAKVDRELFWEMSPLVNGERRVVITPENNFFMHPLVATMIARAPELPGFRFMAYRNSVEPENIAGWVKWKAGRWIPDVQIIAEVAERNCINLTFIAKEFSGHDKRRDIAYCFALCEAVWGQDNLEHWIGELYTRSTSTSLLAKIRSFFTGEEDVPLPVHPDIDKSFHRENLEEKLNNLKAEIITKLPNEPLWKLDHEKLDHALVSFGDIENSKRKTCSTIIPQIFQALGGPPHCFNSERFSRFGEKFCYLKIEKSAVDYPNEIIYRSHLEEAIDVALRRESIGCVTGGGWGAEYNYVDLAPMDIELAIPVLRKVVLDLGLPKATWLRFYDGHFAKEWVGMCPDTPALESLEGW